MAFNLNRLMEEVLLREGARYKVNYKAIFLLTICVILAATALPTITHASGVGDAIKSFYDSAKDSVIAYNYDLSFESYYSKGHNLLIWVGFAAAAVLTALAVYFSAGTATPIVASIGTWIGEAAGLSGIAATNYGLALLGGGSIASGGFGIAGGVVILTTIFAGGSSLVFDYSVDSLLEKYDKSVFIERTANLPVLPIPRENKGSEIYESIIEYLHQNYDDKQSHNMEKNRDALHVAIEMYESPSGESFDNIQEKEKQQIYGLMAILKFNTERYDDAARYAKMAMGSLIINEIERNEKLEIVAQDSRRFFVQDFYDQLEIRYSLPAAIWATSILYEEDVDIGLSLKALKASMRMENDNEMIPLVVAIYLDRLLGRQDIFKSVYLEEILEYASIALKEYDIRTPVIQMILTRAIIMAKKENDFIEIVRKFSPEDKARILDYDVRLKGSFSEYKNYNKIAKICLKEINKDEKFLQDSQVRETLFDLVGSVAIYEHNTEKLARYFQ